MNTTGRTTLPTLQILSAQHISTEVLLEKYAKGQETSIEAVNQRVARALAQAEGPAQARNGRRVSPKRYVRDACQLAASSRRRAPGFLPR